MKTLLFFALICYYIGLTQFVICAVMTCVFFGPKAIMPIIKKLISDIQTIRREYEEAGSLKHLYDIWMNTVVNNEHEH